MIKSEKGSTQLTGNVIDLVSDFASIISSMRLALTDKMSEEQADKLITFAGELAYAHLNDDDAREIEVGIKIADVLNEA